jgi:CubicO group peptidase (beta-lactamase class C family)
MSPGLDPASSPAPPTPLTRAALGPLGWGLGGATLALASITGCHAPSNSEPGLDPRVERVIREHLDERRIPGASIGVVTEDGLLFEAAFGLADVQNSVPAAHDSVYEIASLTKQFTAAAVLLLADEGRLGLDDSISQYVAEAPKTWADITLRQLLQHTAGFPDESGQFASLRGRWQKHTPREVMLTSARLDPLESAPGAAFRYSSVDYFLAAIAIEAASGVSYREFMRTRIFEPLGMSRTYLQDERRITPREAHGYTLRNGELVNIWRDAEEEVAGGWGMFSCVPDLLRWDRAIRDGALLSPESWAAMFEQAELADGARFRYGLGWWVPQRNGVSYQYHNGITGTELLRIPSLGTTVVVLTNLGQDGSIEDNDADPWGLADRIAQELHPEFEVRVDPIQLDPEFLEDYAGQWLFADGPATTYVEAGQLRVRDRHGDDPLLPTGPDVFRLPGDPTILRFHRDPSGRISAAGWVGETWAEERGERIPRGSAIDASAPHRHSP